MKSCALRLFLLAPCLILAAGGRLSAIVQITQLSPSLQSPQPVATPVTWQAAAADTDAGTLVYQFSAKAANAANFTIVRDYHPSSSFGWTRSDREGPFQVKVTVRNLTTQSEASLSAPFGFTSRVSGSLAVVSATAHPLVFLYSAPACSPGSFMRAQFQRSGANVWQFTPFRVCNGITSMNFYLAGMRASTQFAARHQTATSGNLTSSGVINFTTGAIPSGVVFPSSSVVTGPNAQTSLADGIILHDYALTGNPIPFPTARNLAGDVLWYYNAVGGDAQKTRFFTAPVTGGTLLLIANDETNPDPLSNQNQLLREIDLAGNTIRETSVQRVSEQLIALDRQPITSFHHDAIRLANGHTLVVASEEKIFPAGTQGSTADVDILGDQIVDLDENLQVAWVWSSFDHMNIARAAVLGETCHPLQTGCPPVYLAPVANDWLHSNSLSHTADGHLLVSMRHQDWVVKIDYANGTGSGNVLWRLGKDGDFTVSSSDPYPWFSHQHDAGFEGGGTTFLSLYDNGNTRKTVDPAANSRGQVYQIDEVSLTASLPINADLGAYSLAVGNAHRLRNGNYHFGSGFINPPSFYSQAVETLPSGAINYVQQSQVVTYRSYRMLNLYTPPLKYTFPNVSE